jgi:prepilin-type N-terminal cleavage/methylation domain-containing protein
MKNGFTLIELLIVLSILGILAALGWGLWAEADKPTLTLKKSEWTCVETEKYTRYNVALKMPQTIERCVVYTRNISGS